MKLVLLGDPVGHSRSPAIHTAALAQLDITGEYLARAVDRAGLHAAAEELRAGVLDGANVTMPHKRSAATLCDRLDRDAAASRAANTLAMRDGTLVGWNTDVAALRVAGGRAEPERPILILGAGGAAAAALAAFHDAPMVLISARRPGAADHLIRELESSAIPVPWGTVEPDAVVVNATSLGMNDDALPQGVVEEASMLIDLPYGPVPTPASRAALAAGIPCVDGVDLLVAQAAESFRIWTGAEPPLDVMRTAARLETAAD